MALSFSASAKSEISKVSCHKPCCAMAQCFGILLFCNSFSRECIRIITESREFAAMLPKLFRKAFSLSFDVLPDKIYNVSLTISNDGLTFDVNTGVNKPDKPSSVANLVKLPSNANCHMINPNFSKTASGYPVYELPINRIDECWGPS